MSISYDRIYESANLATEMINGQKEDYTIWTVFTKLVSSKYDSLGDVYFRHLDPINLHEYLQ